MKTKVLLYPFTKELSLLVRYRELISSNICSVIGLRSCGIIGKDVSAADGGAYTGMRVDEDFDSAVKNCDEVWFFETALTKDVVSEKARIASSLGKSIRMITDKHNKIDKVTDAVKLRNISAPVIMVSGIGENTSKFEVQLAIRRFFLEHGYSISQLGSSSLSSLFGFDAMPLMSDFTLEEKVFSLNKYLYDKTIKENADVLIVGAPGGIRGLDVHNLNHFAEMTFAVSFAVKADISICCMYNGVPTKELFEYLSNFYVWRFGVINEYYHINNVIALVGSELEKKKTRYMTLDKDEVTNVMRKSYKDDKSCLFSVLDNDSLTDAMNRMLSILQRNSEAIR